MLICQIIIFAPLLYSPAKAMRTHALNFLAKSVPVDAIGLQSHLSGLPNLAGIQVLIYLISNSCINEMFIISTSM